MNNLTRKPKIKIGFFDRRKRSYKILNCRSVGESRFINKLDFLSEIENAELSQN